MTHPIARNILQSFTALGELVGARYRRANYNDEALPAIAAEALAEFDVEVSFDAAMIADLLATTTVAQQPALGFSDLPVTVYRQRDFYIEILVWTQSTTSVHQHGFGGAFKVLQGSSVHTRFEFTPERVISPDCLLGEVTALGTEFLPTGSVQPIQPGPQGLIHSLYHLESPSLTLVVRSHGHARRYPQYTLYRPSLAFDVFRLAEDELVVMYRRLLQVSRQVDRAGMLRVWAEQIARLDFARLAYLYLNLYDGFRDESEREVFLEHAAQTHGKLIVALRSAAVVADRLERISEARSVLSDPELRFFLALLMNAADRASLLELIQARYPERDPLECYAGWLARLSEGKADTARRLTRLIQESEVGALHLGRKLGLALPKGVTEAAAVQSWFRSFMICGANGQAAQARCQQHPDLRMGELQAFLDRMYQLEELACLF